MYTVAFTHVDGNEHVSRHFDTARAARRWMKWLATTNYAKVVKLYKGQAGDWLVETIHR